jgi:hypothetical protein
MRSLTPRHTESTSDWLRRVSARLRIQRLSLDCSQVNTGHLADATKSLDYAARRFELALHGADHARAGHWRHVNRGCRDATLALRAVGTAELRTLCAVLEDIREYASDMEDMQPALAALYERASAVHHNNKSEGLK